MKPTVRAAFLLAIVGCLSCSSTVSAEAFVADITNIFQSDVAASIALPVPKIPVPKWPKPPPPKIDIPGPKPGPWDLPPVPPQRPTGVIVGELGQRVDSELTVLSNTMSVLPSHRDEVIAHGKMAVCRFLAIREIYESTKSYIEIAEVAIAETQPYFAYVFLGDEAPRQFSESVARLAWVILEENEEGPADLVIQEYQTTYCSR